jgi:hypothetical protein
MFFEDNETGLKLLLDTNFAMNHRYMLMIGLEYEIMKHNNYNENFQKPIVSCHITL